MELNIDTGVEEFRVQSLHESVSDSADGTVNLPLNNLSVTEDSEVEVSFAELAPSKVTASILTQKMDAYTPLKIRSV